MNKKLYSEINKLRTEGNTWVEVADVLNLRYNQNYDESAYRKPYQAYELGQKDSITDIETAEQLQRIALEKKKLGMIRGATNEMIRDVAIKELYQEQILDAINNLPKLELNPNVKMVNNTNDEYIVVLSDLHYDGYFNLKYIFEHLLKEISYYFKNKKVSKITLVELGDTIEGSSLRPSQMRGIKTGMIDQIIKISNYYSVFISNLQRLLKLEIDFHIITSSNHTQLRPQNTKRNELPDEDLMKVFANYMEILFENKDVINVYKGEHLVVKLKNGKTFYFSHGDKYKMTPNTLVNTCKDISMYHNRIYDYYGFGHFHQYMDKGIDKSGSLNSRVFLFPALSPTKDSYERLGLMGANPAFSILEFNNGEHKTTININSLAYN